MIAVIALNIMMQPIIMIASASTEAAVLIVFTVDHDTIIIHDMIM